MEQTKKLNIVQLHAGEKNVKKDLVIKEIPLTILVNGQEIVTLLVTPYKLEYLAVGFLLSEGLIRDKTLIKSISLGKDGHYVNLELNGNFQLPLNFFQKRLISSGCGRGSFFYNPQDILDCQVINSDIQISYRGIVNLMKEFQEKSSLFKQTGGVHSAALCNLTQQIPVNEVQQHKAIEIFAEDIGRHNAIDKVLGECLLKEIPTENKIILTSGRISSEILIKIVKRKIPFIISRAAPTDLAIGLAERMRVTLIGFLRGKRMNIYTHSFRIN